MIVDAPNESHNFLSSDSGQLVKQLAKPYFSALTYVPVGPPPAKLSVAIVSPGDYQGLVPAPDPASVDHCTHFYMPGPRIEVPAQGFEADSSDEIPPAFYRHYVAAVQSIAHPAPKATIIVLHGYGLNKYSMLPWAFILGEAGYRAVLVDLRGHGASTGKYSTYGILESRDIEQVVNWLESRDLVAGPLAVLGDSLGAAVAIDVAANDGRIKAIVALQPFERADQVIENYGSVAYPALNFFIPDSSIKAGEREAGELAGVDLANAAPIEAVKHISAPILFLYGDKDKINARGAAKAFESAAPDGQLIMFKGYDHLDLAASLGATAPPVLKWLASRLGGGTPNILMKSASDKSEQSPGSRPKGTTRVALLLSFCIAA